MDNRKSLEKSRLKIPKSYFPERGTQQEYNERYYEEMLNVVKNYKDYSMPGHMDIINRYDEAGIYPFEKVKPLVEEILKTVIADGKGIELNTSYHRYGLDDTTLSVEILKLYRDLGGSEFCKFHDGRLLIHA